MKGRIAILLAACLAVLGSGMLQHRHAEDHARAQSDCCTQATSEAPAHPASPHEHDEGNCQLCILLHQPLAMDWRGSALIGAFEPVGNVHFEPVVFAGRANLDRIDCRGPPTRLF